MQIYSLPAEQNRIPAQPRAIALGIFDGAHLGHQAVITAAVATGYLPPRHGDHQTAAAAHLPAGDHQTDGTLRRRGTV